jgi:hypothetical protein
LPLYLDTAIEPKERRQTFQTIAWFRDLHARKLLDLSPSYQRRSVWNQGYRDYFAETVLVGYPAPTIFLHEDMSPDGVATYSVVDGKQRLTTIFDFADDLFPVRDGSVIGQDGKFFSQLDEAIRRAYWRYQFSVEYLPSVDESVLKDIFDRLNRNVARLTRQELRHARYEGEFTTAAEKLSDAIAAALPTDFPNIARASRRQMKDVEMTSQLLLLVENGPQSFSQDELDAAYSARNEEWSVRTRVEREFHNAMTYLAQLAPLGDPPIASTRLRNQADFYSLFGAVVQLGSQKTLPPPELAAVRLGEFITKVANADARLTDKDSRRYYEAARSASNDLAQRKLRIELLLAVLTSESA